MPSPKKKASDACSRYIRLRDALKYCDKMSIDISQFSRPEDLPVKCCTCGIVKSWIYMDAGHFISRGSGGSSGVYFDERNIHAQSKDCNAWKQGSPDEYREFIIEEYGQEVLDELNLKHRIPIDLGSFAMIAIERYYKERYKELVDSI